ncbi:hypothetical protein FACS1894167_11480 [Synergistales bacterium]|nr:hypothetical protein FACS1894167_11480 [Synergistales bacterium]
MANYSEYIGIRPHYESVVDMDSEKRNPNLWRDYIVHDDMKNAVGKICESISYEQKDARRSFWIHGSYGTGKSYAALVLKHLFEDTAENVADFMSNPKLKPHREKFASLREKGDYLVVWKSGCSDIRSGTQLMMSMEVAIRERLKEKFGDNAYYGGESLVAAAQNTLSDSAINWGEIFTNPAYRLADEFESLDDFKSAVSSGDMNACNRVAVIARDKGWAFMSAVDKFEEWIKDVIAGNNLRETGIFFIWDEFTGFLRECGDDNVLQRLSELCKQPDAPFFMCLIVHRDPGWVANLGDQTYARILHRYHELEFRITESAAYDLIGGSIIPCQGREQQWEVVKNKLINTIGSSISDFDHQGLKCTAEHLKLLCPLHPMTLTLLTIVSQNFGAAQQRTLFRFMKDRLESGQSVGFIHYIENFGPDDWRWLTPDFLWDYFFTRDSDIRERTAEARDAYQHYEDKHALVSKTSSDIHVFKAALLLIAVMSSGRISNLFSQAEGRKLQATKSALYKCFAGHLKRDDVDLCLDRLEEMDLLRMDKKANDTRIELPYAGKADVFRVRLDATKKKHTRHLLFNKKGVLSSAIEVKMWDKNRSTYNRMEIAACSNETNSITTRLGELRTELDKNSYEIGILVVAVAETSQFETMQERLEEITAQDMNERLVICLLKEPFTEEKLGEWHRAITNKELAAEAGKSGSANEYETEAQLIIETWASSAANGQMIAFYQDKHYPSLLGSSDLIGQAEKEVIGSVFPAAPENVVTQSTAFKRATESAALAGITGKTDSTQIKNIANGLKAAQVLEISTLEELAEYDATPGAKSVAELAQFLRGKLEPGAKVRLDDLWFALQDKPFGYYNSMACAYLLGFVLRFYVNGDFNWVKTDKNTFPPTEKNMASMIQAMCSGDVTNNTLSSGSDTWRAFQPYAQKVFGLSLKEAVNEDEARKYIRERIVDAGTPFWVLKSVPEEKWGSSEMKEAADGIISAFCRFISSDGDQESVMAEVVDRFSGKGQVRKLLTELFTDSDTRYSAFRAYIFGAQPEIEDYYNELAITDTDLFDTVKSLMQDAIYTWQEKDFISKLDELVLDFRLAVILKNATRQLCKSVSHSARILKELFAHMTVPGAVLENLGFSWIPALQEMYALSKNEWTKAPTEKKIECADILAAGAKGAYDALSAPKELLSAYMRQNDLRCTEEELDGICRSLKKYPYDTPEAVFKTGFQKEYEKVSYERDKAHLLELWRERSDTPSVSDWCKKYSVPIQWVVEDTTLAHVRTLKKIQDGQLASYSDLRGAVEFFEKNDLAVLKDTDVISSRFFDQIGERYRFPFQEYGEELHSKIRAKFSADVYSWENKVGGIRDVVGEYVAEKKKKEHRADARKRVLSMSEGALRERVLHILEQYPELYESFVD